MIWREKRILLTILGVLLLANTAFFFTYRVQYETRLQDLDTKLHESEKRLQRAQNARITAQRQIDGYHKVQTDIQSLYYERWATEPERFTSLVSEIKKVTAACHMVPQAIGFSESAENQKGGGIGTATVHITFSVSGTYTQVRRLINLLELSDQFVIIDGISVSGTDPNLTLNLRLKTIFRDLRATSSPNKQL